MKVGCRKDFPLPITQKVLFLIALNNLKIDRDINTIKENLVKILMGSVIENKGWGYGETVDIDTTAMVMQALMDYS